MTDTRRPKGPAPPDPGIIPGGIGDRAMRAVLERGPIAEDPERTKPSQEFWRRHFRERQKRLARADQEGVPLGRPPAAAREKEFERKRARTTSTDPQADRCKQQRRADGTGATGK